MPPKASRSEEMQLAILKTVAANTKVLVVLDGTSQLFVLRRRLAFTLYHDYNADLWDSAHESPFSCIDEKTGSRILVTTRIRGILSHGEEVRSIWICLCAMRVCMLVSHCDGK